MKTHIQTEQLTIRPLFKSDLEDVLAITGLPETFFYIPEEPMNEQKARSMIKRGQNYPDRGDIPPVTQPFFAWFPDWSFPANLIGNSSQYSQAALSVTIVAGFFLNWIAGPVVEKLYFRGYLPPRDKG